MPFADLDGVRIHYQLDGADDAPVVVLSNSLGSNLRLWEPQMPALRSRWRIVRYDPRGHGASSAPPGPYTLDELGRDVLGLADRLGVERFRFCGISMGGVVGMWLGTRAPDRLEKLALCNTGARIGTREGWDERISAVHAGGVGSIADGVLGRWFTPAFASAHPDAVAQARRMLLDTPAEGYAGASAALRDADLREQLGQIRAPTLIIAGSADASTPPAGARFLAERIPSARYLELNAAHLSNIEAAEPFTTALVRFFGEDAEP